MKKEHIVQALAEYIEDMSSIHNLAVTNRGTGTAFDYSFWKGLLKDNSGIPDIIAKNDDMFIELRSFWDSPELDIRKRTERGMQTLQVLNFSDGAYKDKEMSDMMYSNDIYKLIEKGIIRYEFEKEEENKVIQFSYKGEVFCERPSDGKDDEPTYDEIMGAAGLIDRKPELKAELIRHLKQFYHTGDFHVNQIRVDNCNDLDNAKELVEQIYDIVDIVTERVRELAAKEKDDKEIERR